jgi:hypothetical protein
MKGSNSGKSVKKQAGKDPWGAQGRKRREAEMARANARKRTEQAKTGKAAVAKADKDKDKARVRAKAGTDPGAARNRSDARGRSRSAQPETPRTRRRIAVAMLVLMALAIVGYILSGPLLRNLDASAEIKAKQVEFEKEQAKTEDLLNRKAQANDIKFLEEEARRIGYVLPGEIPVIVVEDAPPQSTDGDPAQPPDSPTANPNP